MGIRLFKGDIMKLAAIIKNSATISTLLLHIESLQDEVAVLEKFMSLDLTDSRIH